MADRKIFRRLTPLGHHLREWSRRLKLASLGRWWSFAFLVFLLTWLMGLSIGSIPEDLREGAIAPYDIRADREYRLIDEVATNAARAEALKNVLPVYDYYTGLGPVIADRLRGAFEATRQIYQQVMREHAVGGQPSEGARTLSAETFARLRGTWEETAGITVTDPQWNALADEEWGFGAQELIVTPILRAMGRPIVADHEAFMTHKERGMTIRRLVTPDAAGPEEELTWRGRELQAVQPLEVVRKSVSSRVGKERLRRPVNGTALLGIGAAALQANCAPNVLATEERRSDIVKEVPERHRILQAGEVIVRRGEPYSADDIFLLEGIRRQKAVGAFPLKFIGNYFFIALLVLLVHSFGQLYIRKYSPQRSDLLFLGGLLVVMVAVCRAGGIVSEALADALPLPIPRFAYLYLMPLAAGGMLARFLINSETAILFAGVFATFAGLLFPQDPSFTAYAFATAIAGATVIAHVDKRSTIIRAGLMVGIVNVCAVVGIQLMRAGALTEILTLSRLCWYAGTAFTSGVVSAIVVLTLTPVAESLFGYTTDIKLLELANLNHPLLRELIIRAPGTYHHSHLVGILAEAAAQAIGANPLLSRVAAYYHDIGKMRKPLYFAENVKDGESRHERLTAHMSALIISSHIKDGLELARTYKLPEKITAMIPQHHGTNRIGYFFERAKEAADPALGPVEEKDFRYPGPKPQTREAGTLLLADQTEGAVRALKEKTPARIQQTVEQIINKNFAEGQLDECELTLRNLNQVADAFARILLAIYHQRIEYPKETLKLHEKDVPVLEESTSREVLLPTTAAKHPPPTRH